MNPGLRRYHNRNFVSKVIRFESTYSSFRRIWTRKINFNIHQKNCGFLYYRRKCTKKNRFNGKHFNFNLLELLKLTKKIVTVKRQEMQTMMNKKDNIVKISTDFRRATFPLRTLYVKYFHFRHWLLITLWTGLQHSCFDSEYPSVIWFQQNAMAEVFNSVDW